MTFDHPVTTPDGKVLSSAPEALQYLTVDWEGERGPLHRDAVETCLKVIDGHRSTSDAVDALNAALSEMHGA